MAHGHGGRRMGAGRPGGTTPAGRALRTMAREMLADIVGTERDPLLVAIEIATDKKQPAALRLEAALGCAKFLHPTLSAQAVAVSHKTADASAAVNVILDRLAKLSPPPVIDIPVADPIAREAA